MEERARGLPQWGGPAGEFARNVARAFVEGGRAAASVVVLTGPKHSGKRTIADWVVRNGGSRVFRVDPKRLRGGSSFVPRKPLVVVDGIDGLAKQAGAQRRLAMIIDAVRDRGDRILVTMEHHPLELKGLHAALLCRLQGGLIVQLAPPGRAQRRLQLRDEARRLGRRLPSSVEDELVELSAEDGLATLRHRISTGDLHGGTPAPPPLERMKDCAASLFHVERALLDEPVRRRSIVEARRAIMAAAVAEGLSVTAIAESFQMTAPRTIRAACKWAKQQAEKDAHFAALVRELSRVAAGR